MKMYYAQPHKWTDEQGALMSDKPRMEVRFVQATSKAIKEMRFDREYMVMDKEEGYIAAPRFQGYEVFDMRITN